VIAFVSYIGSAKFGGQDYLKYGWDLIFVAIVGAVFYAWGVRCGWRTPDVDAAQRDPSAVDSIATDRAA
jgi:hypothetical protein